MSPNSLFMLLALGLVVCVAGVILWVLLRQRAHIGQSGQGQRQCLQGANS